MRNAAALMGSGDTIRAIFIGANSDYNFDI